MSTIKLNVIIDLISSSKIRERTDGLVRLEEVNFTSPTVLSNMDDQNIISLIQSLSQHITLDKLAYFKTTSNNQVLVRLIRAANLMQTIISKVVISPQFIGKFKYKSYDTILRILSSHILYKGSGSGSGPGSSRSKLVGPVALNMVKALNSFIDEQSVKDHLYSKNYQDILNTTLECLNILTSESTIYNVTHSNETLISEFLCLFYKFLGPVSTSSLTLFLNSSTSSAIDNYYHKIINVIIRFSKNNFPSSGKESESLIFIFKILNQSMIDMSTIDIKLCYRIYRIGSQLLLRIKNISFSSLREQVIIFLNLIPHYINLQKLPKMIGDNWNINKDGELVNPTSNNVERDITPGEVMSEDEDEVEDEDEEHIINTSESLDAEGYSSEMAPNLYPIDRRNPLLNDGVVVEDTEVERLNDLRFLITYFFDLLYDTTVGGQLGLDQSHVNIKLFPLTDTEKLSWFETRYLNLTVDGDSNSWLMTVGLSKLILSFFELKSQISMVDTQPNNNVLSFNRSHNDGINPLKRRRISTGADLRYQVSDNLTSCNSYLEFILTMTSYDVVNGKGFALVCLQLFTLQVSSIASNLEIVSNYNIAKQLMDNSNRIVTHFLKSFEIQDPNVDFWVLVCLKVLISLFSEAKIPEHDVKIKTVALNMIFKYSLDMIKNQKLSKAACSLLCAVVKANSTNAVSLPDLDRSILQQLEMQLELSEINGPSILCKESVQFWFCAYELCKLFKFPTIQLHGHYNGNENVLFAARAYKWLQSKWNQILDLDDPADIGSVSALLLWLSSSDCQLFSKQFTDDLSSSFSSSLNRVYWKWNERSTLQYNILMERNVEFRNIVFVNQTDTTMMNNSLYVPKDQKDAVLMTISTFMGVLANQKSHDKPLLYTWALFLYSITYSISETAKDGNATLNTVAQFFTDQFCYQQETNSLEFSKSVMVFIEIYNKTNSHLFNHPNTDLFLKNSTILAHMHNCLRNSNPTGTRKSLMRTNHHNDVMEFDDLGFVRKQESTNVDKGQLMNSDSTVKYNCMNLRHTSTLEYDAITYLFKHSDDLTKSLVQLVSGLDSEMKQVACYYYIALHMEKNGVCDLDKNSLEMFISTFTNTLQAYRTKTCEITIVTACKLLRLFCNVWVIQYDEEDACSDIYHYLMLLKDRNMLFTEKCELEFLKLRLSILRVMKQDLGPILKEQLLGDVVSSFQDSSSFIKCSLVNDIVLLCENSEDSTSLNYYTEFVGAFSSPQKTVETTGAFSMFCTTITTVSESIMLSCVCNLLELSQYAHFKIYIRIALSDIASINGFHTSLEIFRNFKEIIFKIFWGFKIPLDEFPFDLLGFESFHELIYRNYKELTALCLAYNDVKLLSQISTVTQLDRAILVRDSLSLAIAMSWTKDAIMKKVFLLLDTFLGTKKRQHLKQQIVLIVYELLRLCDMSSESEIYRLVKPEEMIPTSSDDYEEGLRNLTHQERYKPSLFEEHDAKIKFLDEYELFIHPTDAFNVIESLTLKFHVEEFWNLRNIYFLATRFLLLIDSSPSSASKLLNLRKIKWLFLKSKEAFQDPNLVKRCIDVLAKYIYDDLLSKYVSDFISIIQINVCNKDDDGRLWIPIFRRLLETQSKIEGKSLSFLRAFAYFDINSKIDKYERTNTVPDHLMILRCATSKNVGMGGRSLQADQIGSILYNILDENSSFDLIHIISLLFEMDKIDWQGDDSSYSYSFMYDKLAQTLYELQMNHSSEFSDKFNLWIARCLGSYYLSSCRIVDVEVTEFSSDLFQTYGGIRFESEVGLLDTIFRKMEREQKTATIETKACFESIVGCLIYKRGDSSEPFDTHFSVSLLDDYISYLLPMDNYTCSLVNAGDAATDKHFYHDDLVVTLRGFANSVRHSAFEVWTIKIFFAFIKELGSRTSIVTLLATYISHVPSFASLCFSPMVLFYINSEGPKAGKLIAKMITELFSIEEVPQDALKLFLELVLLIRIGTKYGHKKYVSIYEELPHDKIYHAAQVAGSSKAALMLMEDLYHNNRGKYPTSWTTERDFLFDVYSSINESDLIFGLPIDPTLEYGLNILRNKEIKGSGLMFENASFETSLARGEQSDTGSNNLVGSMLNVGLTGVSRVLGDYLNNEQRHDTPVNESKDQIYERAWKLNQWDIPTPDTLDSENKAIYSNLKMIHDSLGNKSKVRAAVNQNLLSVLHRHSDFLNFSIGSERNEAITSWFRALSVIKSTGDISNSSEEDFVSYYDELKKKLSTNNSFDFDSLENVILGRKSAFEMLASMPNCSQDSQTYFMCAIHELHFYGKLARAYDEDQKSINSAVYLNSLASSWNDKSFDVDTKAAVSRLSRFHVASAFWAQKSETNFPVVTLKGIIESESDYDKTQIPRTCPTISDGLLRAILTKWCSESRQESSSILMRDYIETPSEIDETNNFDNSEMYHIFAEFCDAQIRGGDLDKRITRLEVSTKQKARDLRELEKFSKTAETDLEKRDASRVYSRIKVQYKAENEELKQEIRNKQNYITKAIDYYLKAIACSVGSVDDTNVDRFCALWLENSSISIDEYAFKAIPTHKFIPWINQLASRLLSETSGFQKLLNHLIFELSGNHPFHSLYLLKSLRLTAIVNTDSTVASRAAAAESIWKRLYHDPQLIRIVDPGYNIMEAIDWLCDYSVKIANAKTKPLKKIPLSKVPGGSWWLDQLPHLRIPPPCITIKHTEGSVYSLEKLPTITKVEPYLMTAPSGISHPKIMKLELSTGENYRMILKGGSDDLRQDAIMEQVFGKVNLLLERDEQARKRNLRIRTYNVIPLGPGSGVIEFVSNTMALNDILKALHEKDEMKIDQARTKMKECQQKSTNERIAVYKQITSKIKPQFMRFFFNNFVSPDQWFESRLVYGRGVATTSIIGHILGLGDRHCNNILIDKSTGEPVHIDLGVSFDQSKALPIPETVPFRLTRDIVDGLGITGVNGVFSKSCENVFRVLRMNTANICGILDVLKYDPLYSWSLSPIRKKKLQDIDAKAVNNAVVENLVRLDLGSEANIAIDVVKKKLEANGLNSEAVIRELVREATSEENLAVIYLGWSPFL
ncbi:hypothetical protein CANARDRAFT_213456 [[Candida] arabinofermentans NRRL YB-2248]|uniref:Serine/threonine-protein kinase Tel1 n=1 Tax=[Candida] arabinofermentans NRRL YB-2248 TaxID=983967 RepID=A0A1E4SYJ2_9ASCO|nr:hypothetical protein CANARDRAFT_213456 [[Candida] arabinofermentans NRRL YB-2248]